MGGSSKRTTVGYKYYLGMHLVLCHGPADKATRLRVDKRVAWTGNSTGGRININASGLFGGEEREGGIQGAVDLEMGESTQPKNDYLMARLGSQIPAFRGVVSTVLRQVYMGVNPYLKPWAWTIQRIHKTSNGATQWYDDTAEISRPASAADRNVEDFSQGLDPYSLLQGDIQAFSIVDTPYGKGLRVKGNFGSSGISRTDFKAIYPTRVTWRFILNSLGDDDPLRLNLRSAAGEILFEFIPYREDGVDSQRRPWVNTTYNDGANGVPFNTVLSTGIWYQLVLLVDWDSGTFRAEIRDGAALVSALSLDTWKSTPVSGIGFGVDEITSANTEAIVTDILVEEAVQTGDMNPAHIIRECLVDSTWGMGYTSSDIDEISFSSAADTLYEESMGISILWDRQIPIEEFVAEIIRHINATLYIDRVSGKFTLRLIRKDYDPDDLITLGESSIEKVSSYSRVDPGDGINSVTVIYNDSLTGEKASVTVEDIALIQAYGGVVNTTIQYPGFRNKALAARAAERDLKTLSAPLLSATIEASRVASELNIGDVFKFEYPDYHDGYIVMRVHQIALGDGRKNRVKITATEDIFTVPLSPIVGEEESGWVEPGGAPLPVPDQLVFESPYYELCQELGQTNVDSQLSLTPEVGYLQVAASRPENGLSARVWVDSGAGYEETAALDFCPSADLAVEVGIGDVFLELSNTSDLDEVRIGSHVEVNGELMLVQSIDLETEIIGVGRAILDSIPARHPEGSRVLFWDDYSASDSAEYVLGEEVDVKVLTASSQGNLPITDASASTVIFNQRAIRPYRPANLRANNLLEPDVNDFLDYPVQITWVHRNRLQETDLEPMTWTEASVLPEDGTTYFVEVDALDASLAFLASVKTETTSGLTTEVLAAEVDLAFAGAPFVQVTLTAQRDGFDSWQSPFIIFKGPFRAPTDLSAAYLAPAAPANLTGSNVF